SYVALRCLDYRYSGICQTCRWDDVQTTVGEFLRTQFSIVAFQTYNNRHFHTHIGNGRDNSVGNQVTANDTAENVDQYGLHIAVRQNDLERYSDSNQKAALGNIFGGIELKSTRLNSRNVK